MRKGSGKLLKTLMMRLSFVTEYISGPGNCPFIKIPCKIRHEKRQLSETKYKIQVFIYMIDQSLSNTGRMESTQGSNFWWPSFKRVINSTILWNFTCWRTPIGYMSPYVTFQVKNRYGSSALTIATRQRTRHK